VIDAEKLKDIREESVKVVGGYGNNWSSGYVRNRAAITLELLDEIDGLKSELDRWKGLLKDLPFKEGDVVREVGEEEPTGEVIEVKVVNDEQALKVRLFEPVPRWDGTVRKTITYYEDEIELIERPHHGN